MGKMIKVLLEKIVLETIDSLLTGGIDLNVGPFGVNGQIAISSLGDISIRSLTDHREYILQQHS